MSTKTKAPARPMVHRARIPADAMAVLIVQTLVLAGVWVMAICVSFTGLVAGAGWANITGLPRYGVPLFIDGILVGASLAYLVARERKDRASQVIAVLAMLAFCGLSITGNATHAMGAETAGVERLTGILLAVAAPVAILVTTELLARTVIASPDEHQPAPSRSARRAARSATLQPAQAAPSATTESGPVVDPATTAAPVVAARTPRGGTGRGADKAALRARAVELAASGMSNRQIGQELQVAHTTVARMLASAEAEGDTGSVSALSVAV